MNIGELITVKTLDDNNFEDRHTPYLAEIRLFSCVQQGDTELLMNELKKIDSSIIMGKMSDDDIMQYKYMAVSSITLATRYAIQGGLNERTAYDFSDKVIMLTDSLKSKEEILSCVARKILELTESVKKSKCQPPYSPHVKRCIGYINENLNRKITVACLSSYCGITPDYLSQIFKKEIGENLSSYITRRKLEQAKNMLMNNKSYGEICKALGFSSQSHFITSFKKYFHMTPSEYLNFVSNK